MSDESKPIIPPETVKIGKRWSVTFEAHEGGIIAAWSPREPYGRLSGSEMRAYRRARQAFAQRLAEHLDTNILVVDGAPPPPRSLH